MPILVRNLEHESDPPTCGCGTWIRHWENGSNKKKGNCCAYACFEKADRGGHVQKRKVGDDSWYIIPICAKCNRKLGEEYYVNDDTFFVPVGKNSRCKP